MKIVAKKNIVNGTVVYKYLKPQYCCKMLKHNPLVEICNEMVVYDVGDDGSYICDERFGMCLVHSEEVSFPYDDSPWEETNYYPIECCPFCGEPIEIVIIPGEDLTERYNELATKAEVLRKKYYKTDSRKKSKELKGELDQINKMIDELYTTGEAVMA